VSVVLPVHNGGEEMLACLESLDLQDLDPEDFEVIAVDDGSTDGSGDVLDRFAAAHPNVRVVHQAASGGAGGPRNAGTALARGEFVFYLDADDALIPQALRRMLVFAREHESDVVVVGRMTVEGEQVVTPLHAVRVAVDAPLREAMSSLAPHKLIRRELIVKHRVRFPEQRVAFEDGIFLSRVLPRAGRISVLSDRAHYIKHRRPDRLSREFRAPDKGRSMVEIVDTLRLLGVEEAEIDAIAFGLHRRLMRILGTKRFLRLPREQQEEFVSVIKETAAALVPASRDAELPYPLQLRACAFRTGRVRVVASLAEFEHDTRRLPALRHPALLATLAQTGTAKARVKGRRAAAGLAAPRRRPVLPGHRRRLARNGASTT